MKKSAILLMLVLIGCSMGQFRDSTTNIESVSTFDAPKYLGRWYEIARYPNWFEKGCVGVTADYALRDDGQISVTNTCRKDSLDGEISVANGVARIEGVGKLSVTFTPWLPFARGDYWVLGLRDYDVAVVGNPNGKTGWILARNPHISETERQWANEVLEQAGYNTDFLVEVLH